MIAKVSLYQRTTGGKKKWGIRYRANGKDIKEIIGTSKRQAEIAAAAKTSELFGEKFDIPQKQIITIENLHKEYLSGKRNLRESSVNRYKNLFKSFSDFMSKNFRTGWNDVSKIQKHHIEAYANQLHQIEGKAPKTVNGALDLIKSLFSYAVKNDYIRKSPAMNVIKFALKDEKEALYFTRDDLVKIWEKVDPYWLNFLKILYYTGMRKGELINLTWNNVTLKKDEEKVTVISSDDYRTKTGKKRNIPLKKEAIEILKNQKGKDNKYVFVSRTGKKIHPDKPYHAIKKALEKVGLEGDVHKLRHTFASHCVMKGRSIFETKELLGHRDIKSTMIYAHLSPNTLKEAVEVLESFS
ncbi:MAG: site-specific integrase [Candidatus Marinimicrobia bacterium]|nr:site-specific integrase [Candidatus Neomarinimicrobiota bacterium]